MIIGLYGTSCHTEKNVMPYMCYMETVPNQNYDYESHTSTLHLRKFMNLIKEYAKFIH